MQGLQQARYYGQRTSSKVRVSLSPEKYFSTAEANSDSGPETSRQHPALRHRIILNFEAEAEGIQPDEIIDAILNEVPKQV